MKKILNIILISCFSLTVISCGLITEESSDTVAVDTAPTASVTTATITTSENAVVQSTETGTAYLVNTAVTVSNLASITGAADNQSNSVTISSAATNTNLPATGLADGTYKVYAVDSAGLLSSASTNSVTLLIDYALDFDGIMTMPLLMVSRQNLTVRLIFHFQFQHGYIQMMELRNNSFLVFSKELVTLQMVPQSGMVPLT